MATAITAFGRLEINYSVNGKRHDFNVWVTTFNLVTGVFSGTVTGAASVSALAQVLVDAIYATYNTTITVTFGDWQAYQRQADGSFLPVLSGTATPATTRQGLNTGIVTDALQHTVVFRTTSGKIMRYMLFGGHYYVLTKILTVATLPTGWSGLANAILTNTAITGRDSTPAKNLVSYQQDTNDKLRREYGQV